VALTSFSKSSLPQGDLPSEVLTEEYAVYSLLINKTFGGSKPKRLIIRGHTDCSSLCADLAYPDADRRRQERIEQQFPSIEQELIRSYLGNNKGAYQLMRSFHLTRDYTLMEKNEIDQILQSYGKDGKRYKELYVDSGGVVGVSRVGFNREKNQALVYLAYDCGLMCGAGYYFLLIKRDGEWALVKRQTDWNI